MAFGAGSGVITYFARHRTLANLVLVIMVVAGLVAMTRIRAQYFPDVVVAEVSVSVQWPGAGAEDVDRGIVQVLEPALLALEGVSDASSQAQEGSAWISLAFEPGRDLTQATDDVQAAVDAVRDLPTGVETPVVLRTVWRDQVTDVVITGPVSVDQLGGFADELVARLFDAGVTRTTIQGLAAPQVVVEVPSVALIRHDVTMAEIATAIGAAVQTAPAGDVGAGARVRTGVERRGPDQIAAIALRTATDGSQLTIGDLATVRLEGVDRARAYFVGDNPAMTVRVDRNDQGDAIRLQAQVAEVAAVLQASLPQGVRVDLVRTRAEQITDRLALLLDNGLMGLGLVVALLFLFLNARTALWVAAGIPVSLLAAIAAMYVSGMTINMISLFALILMTGIVVDDAIVVGEHADFRARTLGEPPQLAAENGVLRMVAPVLASTLTTVIAFGGLMVVGGRFGDMIADIPWVVIFVLLGSTIECYLILPNHMAHALRHAGRARWYDAPSRVVMRGFDWGVAHLVRPAMGWAITARYVVLALMVLALASQGALFLRGEVQFRFFNGPEQTTVTGNFAMLPGASRDDSLAMMRELQRATEVLAARYLAEQGATPFKFVQAVVGGGSGRGLAGAETRDPDLLGGISIELIDRDLRTWSSSTLVADLQAEVRPQPLLEELSFRGGHFGPGGNALSVDLYGAEAAVLKAAAEAVKTALAPFPEVSGLEDTLAYDKQEMILNLTPQGRALGFASDALGRELRDRLNGIEAASFPDGPRSATIRVELPAGELAADFLDRTLMRSSGGQYVPLGDIVAVESRSGFATIGRENGLRLVTVSGDLAEDDPARAAEVQRLLADQIVPRVEADFGVSARLSGLNQQQDDFLSDAGVGLMAALLGIYLTLAWIFASWQRPLVVMVVIPFGLVGAIWGHAWWGVPMSLFSVVGMIGMTGIIINDAIVLISTIDQYAQDRGLRAAIIDGVADRLRPVLLTTLTTVLGLAPLLYETSSQAEFLRPTVITLVYGLGFGMVLVLLMVPAALALEADVARQLVALRRMVRGGPRAARGIVLAAVVAVLALFAITLGRVLLAGGLPGWLAPLGLVADASAAPRLALALFVAGAAVISAVAWGLGWLVLRPRR
ncbi:MAG: efflux RND transporter permease subunit [Pseudorhodobacter sp.]|nr:efflux RND transporter permease subunit [Pseudorhodobacter sp.]